MTHGWSHAFTPTIIGVHPNIYVLHDIFIQRSIGAVNFAQNTDSIARFEGLPLVTGTIGPVCIYKMHGRYFMRSRSSLTGERVKKDTAFRKTMEYATLLSKASRIGSEVYASLPADQKQHALFRKFTGEAMTWLKYGWKEADVLEWLQQRYTPQEINIFCQRLEEERTIAKASETEEQMITHFKLRMNRRLLRALRRGDFSIIDDRPPDKR